MRGLVGVRVRAVACFSLFACFGARQLVLRFRLVLFWCGLTGTSSTSGAIFPSLGGIGSKKGQKGPRARSVERGGAGAKPAEWVAGVPSGVKGTWRVARLLQAALGGARGDREERHIGGLRAPAGLFDAAKGESIDTGDRRRAVSSSPGRGPWCVLILVPTLLWHYSEQLADRPKAKKLIQACLVQATAAP